jgi:hypothetical protein
LGVPVVQWCDSGSVIDEIYGCSKPRISSHFLAGPKETEASVTCRNSIAGDAPKPSEMRRNTVTEADMAAMRELFKEKGSELYMGAGDRDWD